MRPISIVIIAKNEELVLGRTLNSLRNITDDIVVADTGSTDDTINTARKSGARVETLIWHGFGPTKNAALQLAKYDWVLFLDADEAIDSMLFSFLENVSLQDDQLLYKIKFKNYFGKQLIRYGEWGNESKIKLFNKNVACWDNTNVHEKVIAPPGTNIKIAEGYILHELIDNINEYVQKISLYADLAAQKYFQQEKKASWFKLYIYPFYQFFFFYIIRLGLLDGRIGFITSYVSAYYSFLKYHRLKELSLQLAA